MTAKRMFWPPSKKDLSGQRLAKAFEDSKFRQPLIQKLKADDGLDLSRILKSAEIRGLLFGIVLNLDETKAQDIQIAKAFAAAGLDPTDPFDWHQLVSMFCEAHFGAQKPGRKDEWEGQRYVDLYVRSREIEKALGDERNDARTASELKRKFPNEYRNQKRDVLRKLLPKARTYVEQVLVGQHPGKPLVNMRIRELAQQGKDPNPFELQLIDRVGSLLPPDKAVK